MLSPNRCIQNAKRFFLSGFNDFRFSSALSLCGPLEALKKILKVQERFSVKSYMVELCNFGFLSQKLLVQLLVLLIEGMKKSEKY